MQNTEGQTTAPPQFDASEQRPTSERRNAAPPQQESPPKHNVMADVIERHERISMRVRK
ncbi:MAG: hypothetical protein HFJ81_07490 [Clostridia bacterium]|nr:hypothetical protein [Clostridia bacterium]